MVVLGADAVFFDEFTLLLTALACFGGFALVVVVAVVDLDAAGGVVVDFFFVMSLRSARNSAMAISLPVLIRLTLSNSVWINLELFSDASSADDAILVLSLYS